MKKAKREAQEKKIELKKEKIQEIKSKLYIGAFDLNNEKMAWEKIK